MLSKWTLFVSVVLYSVLLSKGNRGRGGRSGGGFALIPSGIQSSSGYSMTPGLGDFILGYLGLCGED